MRDKRWFSVAVLAVGLFAINAVCRLVIRFGFPRSDAAETRAAIVMFAIIGVVLAVVTFLRAQQVPPSRWLFDVGWGAVGGLLLTVLVGPFVSGQAPFSGGAGVFFSQVWLYGGFAILGVLLGYWIATALGRDYRSRALTAYARSRAAKPHKVVRR
jgi:hypothetical protein